MIKIGRIAGLTIAVGSLVAAGTAAAQDTMAPTTPPPGTTPAPVYNPPPNYAPAPNYNYNNNPGPGNGYNDSIAYPKYRAQEVSIDMFATGTSGNESFDHFSGYHARRDAHAGGGVGLNYFFCRYVGVGGDTYTEDRGEPFIYSASGNVIGRIPIGNTGLAPYFFGGGGHQFGDHGSENFGQAGGGLEYRFCPHVGLFVDGRAVIPGRHGDYGLFRGGLRISF